jgi:hypothetical protein
MDDEKPLDEQQTEILRNAYKVLVPWLQKENERLRLENAALRLDNAEGRHAKGDVDQLRLELAHQDAEIERLRTENAALRQIVTELVADDGALVIGCDSDGAGKCNDCWTEYRLHEPNCIITRAQALLGEDK